MKVCPSCQSEFEYGDFCANDGGRLITPSMVPAALENPHDHLIGVTLSDRYKVLRRIGEGGMGFVYEAEHVMIDKRVALKVLRAELSSRSELVERFRREAKSASKIGHAHIVDVSDFGETPGGEIYFVMELLDGEDLADVLTREASLAPARAVRIVAQCCGALGAAHAKGIVHRDMKPENVFLARRDQLPDFVKIVDFGIAKMTDFGGANGKRRLTRTSLMFGTPEYMSPEQAAGSQLDQRVDVYALGVILYELLAGQTPFQGDDFFGVLTQHLHGDVSPLELVNPELRISEQLRSVVCKALAKNPDERFQTMHEMGHQLAQAPEWGDGAWAKTMPGGPVNFERATGVSAAAGMAATAVAPEAGASVARAPSAPTSRSGLRAAAAGLAVAGLAAAAVLAGMQTDPDTTEPMGGNHAGAPAGSAGESGSAGLVQIRVRTRPAGARISVTGRGEVCESMPCAFQTPKGKPVTLTAHRQGGGAVTKSVTPTEPMTVELRLAHPTRDGALRADKPAHGLARPEQKEAR
ncbi:MAG: serine/threonine protein kinase [Proteobacteria bacterium]|nr:serine/threonine protein kinase [Pseudomonadota bacterium]